MVNQVRISGQTFTGAPIYSEPGGQGPQYYSSVKVRFGTRTFIKGDKVDCSDGEGAEGFRLKYSITKNKCGPIARGGGFMSFNYDSGLMWMEDLLEIAYKFDFIKLINLETGEPYYDEDNNELKGKRKDLEEYIYTNINFQNEYIAMLNRYISASGDSYGNILDAREQAQIKEEEESVEAVQQKAILVEKR